MNRNCFVCEKLFKVGKYNRKYCSKKCQEDAFRAAGKIYMRNARLKNTIKMFDYYGRKCSCLACGFDDFELKLHDKRFLQIDHINGGGRKYNVRGTGLYAWIV